MDKNSETLKKLLVEFREEGLPAPVLDRERNLEEMETKANVIAGIRRSGKTYQMYRSIKEKGLENCFYLNLEDERLVNPTAQDLSNIIPLIEENFDIEKPLNLFIDEIQNSKNWEKWARRIAEKKEVSLYISGSSSRLSSKEIATSLRGRTLTTYNFPLNFREFLDFNDRTYSIRNIKSSPKRHSLKRYFEEYLKFGGFPEIVLAEEGRVKRKLLQEYFSTIITRDIIERHKVGDVNKLENFMKLLVNHFSRLVSFSKVENWLKSMGISSSKSTLINYFKYIKASFFMFDVKIFSPTVKDRLQYPRKIYVIDNGFATALADNFSENRGWYFENLAALELYKKTIDDPSQEVFYWKDKQGKEVDFVIKYGQEVKKLVQVCSDLNDENREREIDSLVKSSKNLGCNNLKLLTEDKSGSIEKGGKKIKLEPIWYWCLQR